MSNSIHFKEATKKDIPMIMRDFPHKPRHYKNILKQHIRIGKVIIGIEDDKLIAISAFFFGGDMVSLTSFWVKPFYRKKPVSYMLILTTFKHFDGKEVLITSKDISTYSKYVESYNGGIVYKVKNIADIINL